MTHPETPRVDLERVGHVVRDAHELGEHERRLLRAVLRDHELHRRRVHAVAQRRDDAEVRDAEQRVELVLLDRLVAARVRNVRSARARIQMKREDGRHALVVHGDEVERAVLAVDVGDELGDDAFELGGVGECGRGDLDHDDVADPFWVVLQELLECPELVSIW